MKDKQGVTRGKCAIPECECIEYVKPPEDSAGVRCEYCDHAPTKHLRTIQLGACTKCKECSCYEPGENDYGSYPDCEYCDCPAQRHENADKLISKQPNQPTAVEMQSTFISKEQAPNHTTIAQVQAALKCMLPGCDKPCSIESSGHVYDFCSKEHALAYNDTNKQKQAHRPKVMQSPTSSIGLPMVDASGTQSLSSFTKICSKCGQKPANPRRGWCQDCYIQSSQT